MSPRYTTVGGYPNADPYYISPEEEAEMAINDWTGACNYCPANFRTQAELEEHERECGARLATLDDDVIAAARRLDRSALSDYALKGPHNFPRDARLVARALLAALKQEGASDTGEQKASEHLSDPIREEMARALEAVQEHRRNQNWERDGYWVDDEELDNTILAALSKHRAGSKASEPPPNPR